MAQPIVNPEIPFVEEVPSGLQPGKMLRFQGVTHPNSDRFNINLATGPNAKPRDDTALHLSVRLNQGYIARNTYKDGSWGDEQGSGKLPIGQGQSFEIIILVDPHHYKIAVNGQHHSEFPHRISFDQVTHLLVDGDVSLTLISFEGIVLQGAETARQASNVNAEGPQAGPQFGGPQYGPPPGAYGAPPPNYGGYGPPPPPGAEPQSEFGGFLEQAQDILAGAIKSGAAEKLLGSILHSSGQPNQQPQGYAPQNAQYGIYPDLPTSDTTQLPPKPSNTGHPNTQDAALSNLIAGSGGTVTSGPQPQVTASEQTSSGPLESLLMGLLNNQGGNSARSNQSNTQSQSQTGGSDVLSSLLLSLVTGGNQNAPVQGQEGNYNISAAPPSDPTKGGGSSDVLSNLLSSLLSSNGGQQPVPQSQPSYIPPQSNLDQGSHGQSSDVLSGILSNLLSGQSQQGSPATQTSQPPIDPQQPGHSGGINVQELTNLLQSLMAKASQQHDSTRPIQETHPTGNVPQQQPQQPQQQYGQYPHPPQEERGPVESLLSGLLSGSGGGQQQQQPHGPQVGGEGSIGGLGSVGGLLGSLAGSLFQRPGPNQGH